VRQDAKREDRTLVNHVHGVSRSLLEKPVEMCLDLSVDGPQLSEVNLDPDILTDKVSIMVIDILQES
jgi:hypothetical protein